MNTTAVRTNLAVAGRGLIRAFLAFAPIWRVVVIATAVWLIAPVVAPNLAWPALIVAVVATVIGLRRRKRS